MKWVKTTTGRADSECEDPEAAKVKGTQDCAAPSKGQVSVLRLEVGGAGS